MIEKSSPQNSPFRKPLESVTRPVSKFLHDHHVTPDGVTYFGLSLSVIGTAVAHFANMTEEKFRRNILRGAATAFIGAGELSDLFDGALHRYLEEMARKEGVEPPPGNPNLDTIIDRIKEIVKGVERICNANHRGDTVGATLASLAMIQQGWPSVLRADIESNGGETSENGKFLPLTIFGTSAGRAAANSAAVVISEIQPAADALVNAPTAFTNIDRAMQAYRLREEIKENPEKDKVDPALRQEKIKKRNMLAVAALASAGTAIAVNLWTRKR